MANPVRVTFKNQQAHFDSSKEAYLWLLCKFLDERPDILESETTKARITEGRCRTYIGRRPEDLFQRSPRQADDPAYFEQVTHGYYAITNLSDDIKFDVLARFALYADFKYERDWTWDDGLNRRPDEPLELEPDFDLNL